MNQNSNPFNHRLSPIDLRIDQFGGISSSMPLDKLNKLLVEKMEINAQDQIRTEKGYYPS